MNAGLRAAWLGSWQVPWTLGRGRRWGDPRWALAALAQAWLLGGREGCWPRCTWQARAPRGPWVSKLSEDAGAVPEASWISLWRHGTTRIPAWTRGKAEDPVRAWAWEALLEGDGTPWMALGSVLLTLEERLAWMPLLGAVDARGGLHLPPFLADLVPEPLWSLPPCWWESLLGDLDAEGRLLPRQPEQAEQALRLIRERGGEALVPLMGVGAAPPGAWQVPGLGWMLPPGVRAWARGWGASSRGLEVLAPLGMAHGGPPVPAVRDLLRGVVREDGWSPSWYRALDCDRAGAPIEEVPAPTGDATLDRIRGRWTSELPAVTKGYPPWGTRAHPCADPFHWMAEGFRCFRHADIEGGLRAFGWAYQHFARLRSPQWSQRAAANAWTCAALWADAEALAHWGRLKGKASSPQEEYEAAWMAAVEGELEKACSLAERVIRIKLDHYAGLILRANLALRYDRRDVLRETMALIGAGDNFQLYSAFLSDTPSPTFSPEGEECRLIWEAVKARRGLPLAEDLWEALERMPNQLNRLDVGLEVLEHRPDMRTPQRLLDLQTIAERARSASRRARLQKLWPAEAPARSVAPEQLVEGWLKRLPRPTWVVLGDRVLGPGLPPPEGLLGRLRDAGSLGPLPLGERVWWGGRLSWEGGAVGHFLTSIGRHEALPEDLDLHVLAPWLAALRPALETEPPPETGHLLWDGSEPMGVVMREAARVAPTQLPVLILGPSGTGKELMAREIHDWSARSGHLVAVNCSAFAEGLLESELFGHVKGAFTGADRDRRGAIEMAEGGTLLLDEVADMSPRIQSMFLRVLQEREVRRVGSERTQRVDVRFLAATHKGLEGLVATGAFRHDLLYRLQGAVLHMPSLAERRHELPFLLPRLLAQVARDMRRPAPAFAASLPEALGRAPWPGNFRQLRHALERALLRCGKGTLGPEHFPELDVPEAVEGTWEAAHTDFQRRLLEGALARRGWNVSEAARDLGLTRAALYVALKRVGIDLLARRHATRAGAMLQG